MIRLLSRLLLCIVMMMCATPAFSADDCHCGSLTEACDACGESEGGCDCCNCSPFASCSECSGFVVSRTQSVLPLLMPVEGIATGILCLPGPVSFNVPDFISKTLKYREPSWEQFASRSDKLRGSPFFS